MFSVDSINWREIRGGGRGERVMGNSNSSNSREIRTKYKGGTIAVGVSADKTSQNALKWAIDYLVTPPTNDVVLKLIHVAQKSPSPRVSPGNSFCICLERASILLYR